MLTQSSLKRLWIFSSIFLFLTVAIRILPEVQAIDLLVSEYMNVQSEETLVMMRALTYLWNLWVVATLTVLVFIWLRKYHEVSVNERSVVFSVATTMILSVVLKFLFSRPRPELSLYEEVWYSYPSFHSAIAVGLYGYIVYLFAVRYPEYKWTITIVWWGVVLMIALSRVYLNVHYLSDIIAGMIIWMLWLLVAIWSDRYRD